jgi:Protein of unknown function (DUF3341)
MSAGVLATFATERELVAALPPLRAAALGTIETYTPKPIETGTSVLPMLILLAGVLGATASFLLQSYGDTVAYPLDIGGRPNFSWPAFIPIAFENGILAAVLVGFLGFLAVNRMPRLYEPVDECPSIRRAARDMWCVAIQTDQPERARAMLRDLSPIHLEELP